MAETWPTIYDILHSVCGSLLCIVLDPLNVGRTPNHGCDPRGVLAGCPQYKLLLLTADNGLLRPNQTIVLVVEI